MYHRINAGRFSDRQYRYLLDDARLVVCMFYNKNAYLFDLLLHENAVLPAASINAERSGQSSRPASRAPLC
ncbi:hypothetical protein PYR71_23710 [Rhizobium sp. MC63]|uniref:Uncharacterized protein n=1 Tax=Rhizobium mulingense TaxID=3031128 RepID=A0ACC6N2F6_9HYPH|nr:MULTISPECIES: hypothetical protein [unclassified Rhizobium]MDF0699454.1 hypothetical protein [Rhizobium sp. MC63]MEA3519771.1 hypothetical protein [Rhizobium sp. MJ31]